MIITRDIDLRKLNSATKYPSIPTFHALGERGKLMDETVDFAGQSVIATEKIDGTNSRIILMPDECYVIGSREELLYARDDLIHNPALGIVDTLRSVADRIVATYQTSETIITTLYLETYGGKTTAAAKQYTSKREFGYRVFDVNQIPVSVLEKDVEEIAIWREHGGQSFLNEGSLTEFVTAVQLELSPRIAVVDAIPTEILDTYDWLKSHLTDTRVALDRDAGGKPEGLVVRTADRGTIAKIRFEDYQRHRKRLNKQ